MPGMAKKSYGKPLAGKPAKPGKKAVAVKKQKPQRPGGDIRIPKPPKKRGR